MKLKIIQSLLFSFTLVCGQEIPTFVKESKPKVAKPFVVTYQIDRNKKWDIPDLKPVKLNDNFEIVAVKQDTIQDKININVYLMAFEAGSYELPGYAFVQNNTDTLYTKASIFQVKRLDKSMLNDPMKDIKPNIEVDLTFNDYINKYRWLFLGLIGVLSLVILTIVCYKIFKTLFKKSSIEKRLPPFEEALLALDKIKKEEKWNENDKVFFSHLTDILRTYFERKLYFNALESTSDEILTEIKPHIIDQEYAMLQATLQESDMVKFAKKETEISKKQHHTENAIDLIKSIEERYVDKTVLEEIKTTVQHKKTYFSSMGVFTRKLPKGEFAMWWYSDDNKQFNQSETEKLLNQLFIDYLTYSPLYLAKILNEKGIITDTIEIHLPDDEKRWTFNHPLVGNYILQYSKELGVRFLFNTQTVSTTNRDEVLVQILQDIQSFIDTNITHLQQRVLHKNKEIESAQANYTFNKNLLIKAEKEGNSITKFGAITLK